MTGLSAFQLNIFVVRPTLRFLGMGGLAAERLVVGTALVESHIANLDQRLSASDDELGPAIGIYQIERSTHDDIWDNFLKFRNRLAENVSRLVAEKPERHVQLATNLSYATAMCRLQYRRAPDPLPDANDLDGMAQYWKKYYNTELGKGTKAGFVLKARRVLSLQ